MKMLTPEELDRFLSDGAFRLSQSELRQIIAQAKLAYSIQQRAAEICKKKKSYGPLNPEGDYLYDLACDHCHNAILNMEIPE